MKKKKKKKKERNAILIQVILEHNVWRVPTYNSGFQVNKQWPRHVFPRTGVAKEGTEWIVVGCRLSVPIQSTIWSYTVF